MKEPPAGGSFLEVFLIRFRPPSAMHGGTGVFVNGTKQKEAIS